MSWRLPATNVPCGRETLALENVEQAPAFHSVLAGMGVGAEEVLPVPATAKASGTFNQRSQMSKRQVRIPALDQEAGSRQHRLWGIRPSSRSQFAGHSFDAFEV